MDAARGEQRQMARENAQGMVDVPIIRSDVVSARADCAHVPEMIPGLDHLGVWKQHYLGFRWKRMPGACRVISIGSP